MGEHFPDVVPLVGEEELAEMWVDNPRGALVTVKVSITCQPLEPSLVFPISPFVPRTGAGSSDPNIRFNALVYLIEFILRRHRIITKTAA